MKASIKKLRRRHAATTLVLAAVVALVFAILWKGLSLNPSIVASSQIGKAASEFEVDLLGGAAWLPRTQGTKVTLRDLRGKLVILNFWASWCVSCRQEARELEAFWERTREQGAIVLGIAIQDTPESVIEFAKLQGKTYPIALDTSGKTSIDYGVSGVPETFIIDPAGVITHKESGPITSELLEKLSSKYLTSQSGLK